MLTWAFRLPTIPYHTLLYCVPLSHALVNFLRFKSAVGTAVDEKMAVLIIFSVVCLHGIANVGISSFADRFAITIFVAGWMSMVAMHSVSKQSNGSK